MDIKDLIDKYNVPAPRYTSYPTVPYWDDIKPDPNQWLEVVKRTFLESNQDKGISLYIHLPYCESLCTYCGCNKRITKNHGVEDSYIKALLQEWQIYLKQFNQPPFIREIHLGGGTPTFFSPANLEILIKGLLKNAQIHPDHEFGLEGHPNNTTYDHLKTLYDLGFRRVSFGVQDFDTKIQKTINRIQPYQKVVDVTRFAREIGYNSVNYDLVYGLPFQTLDIISNTIDLVGELKPDRIAFYSYAHVPWKMPSQRGYTETDLPDSAEKRALYELGKRKLADLGYADVGMDHFALPQDPLFKAKAAGTLHRNFMGYTTCPTDLLLGLGTSSISDAKYAYLQNDKVVETYKEQTLREKLAILKGHFLTDQDLAVKEFILDLTCRGKANFNQSIHQNLTEFSRHQLEIMQKEGLLSYDDQQLEVTEIGFTFIRNIAMVFDARLHQNKAVTEKLFSKAI